MRRSVFAFACVFIAGLPSDAGASALEAKGALGAGKTSRAPAASLREAQIRALLSHTSCDSALTSDLGELGSFRGCAFAWSRLQEKTPEAGLLTDAVRSLDACIPSNRSWARNSPGQSFREILDAAAPHSRRRSPEADRIRNQLVGDFTDLLSDTARYCCGADRACAQDLLNTERLWCKAPADPTSSAPCAGGGAFASMSTLSWDQWQKVRSAAMTDLEDISRRRELGRMTWAIFLSPRFRATGEPLTNYRVIAHELGHVCVGIKRMADVRLGNLAAFTLASDLGFSRTVDGQTDRCRTSASHETYYRKLASDLAMSDETFGCLKKVAASAGRNRFGSGSCDWSCGNDQWEEAMADWVHFNVVAPEKWIPSLMPGFCNFKRDGQHALPADELDCFLKTPQFEARMVSALGCQGG